MKRSVKGILIAGGIFFIAGFALVLAGVMMGASWSQIGETITSGRYSFGNHYFSFIDYDDNDLYGMDIVTSETYDASKIKNIILDVGAGELKINNKDTKQIQIENDDNRGKLGVNVTDDTMHIVLRGRNWGNGGKAEMCIPADLKLSDMQVNISAGTVKLDSVHTKQINVDVGAGKFESTGKIYTEISSWDVDAGNIKADWVQSAQTDLDCDAGKIEITVDGKQQDFGFEGRCSAGKIEFGTDKYVSDAEIYRNDDHAEQFVTASCDAGKIKINFTK